MLVVLANSRFYSVRVRITLDTELRALTFMCDFRARPWPPFASLAIGIPLSDAEDFYSPSLLFSEINWQRRPYLEEIELGDFAPWNIWVM